MIGRRGIARRGGGPRASRGPRSRREAEALSIVPQATLNSVDPIWSTSQVSRNLGFMVFEPLYGRDANGVPQPQMVEADQMEDGGQRWTMRLRPGLLFHDGREGARPRLRGLAAAVDEAGHGRA